MLMMTPSFVQAVSVAYESTSFDEVMRLPSSQRIAMLRIRERIHKEIQKQMDSA